MACIVMAWIVTAYLVMACAYIVMAEAGISSFSLFGSEISVTTPEAFLRHLRPWRRFIEACDVYVGP